MRVVDNLHVPARTILGMLRSEVNGWDSENLVSHSLPLMGLLDRAGKIRL